MGIFVESTNLSSPQNDGPCYAIYHALLTEQAKNWLKKPMLV